MLVDSEFLLNVLGMVDTAIRLTQANLAWRSIAIPHLGTDWEEKFHAALNNPRLPDGHEYELANLRQMQSAVAQMVEIVCLHDSIPPPHERVN